MAAERAVSELAKALKTPWWESSEATRSARRVLLWDVLTTFAIGTDEDDVMEVLIDALPKHFLKKIWGSMSGPVFVDTLNKAPPAEKRKWTRDLKKEVGNTHTSNLRV